MNKEGYLMQHDYYYHGGQMRQAALRQEAERERLVLAAQQGTARFYHHWATWLGRSMQQSGQQLIQFGNRGQDGDITKTPRHVALPTRNTHALKATHMLPEGKM
jgi:hypothetical protein